MTITLDRVADLSEAERAEVRALSLAVYPPELWADWPGRQIEWSDPERCIRVQDVAGTLVSYVGVYLRSARCDERSIHVGGLGNVKTHPSARRRGLARLAMEQAIEFLRNEATVDFALLVCAPHLLAYYARLGWREFTGRLMVQQHGSETVFTFNRVMTLGINAEGPTTGMIDLRGPPW